MSIQNANLGIRLKKWCNLSCLKLNIIVLNMFSSPLFWWFWLITKSSTKRRMHHWIKYYTWNISTSFHVSVERNAHILFKILQLLPDPDEIFFLGFQILYWFWFLSPLIDQGWKTGTAWSGTYQYFYSPQLLTLPLRVHCVTQ